MAYKDLPPCEGRVLNCKDLSATRSVFTLLVKLALVYENQSPYILDN